MDDRHYRRPTLADRNGIGRRRAPGVEEQSAARRTMVLAVAAVIAGAVGLAALIGRPAPHSAADVPELRLSILTPTFQPPVSLLPTSPAADSAGGAPSTPTSEWVTAAGRIDRPEPPRDIPPVPASPTGGPEASPDLAIGSMVGLEVFGRSGYRIRHQNFLARVDALGPDSSELNRADSRFMVRAGFVGEGCVALESTNFPGRFLRHSSFAVRLDPRDGSSQFGGDATFCPAPTRQGAALVLQSANFRNRYLHVRDNRLFFDDLTEDQATAFTIRTPL